MLALIEDFAEFAAVVLFGVFLLALPANEVLERFLRDEPEEHGGPTS